MPTPPGLRRTAIADAALGALLSPVLADFAARFGRVRGGAMAVVAMGKAGGREMMAGSDLDLMLIYDHPDEVTESRGARRMPVSQWFVRAAHAYVAAVTAPGVDGAAVRGGHAAAAVGQQGPGRGVARRSSAATTPSRAWTWERMALTRARVVAGPPALRRRIEARDRRSAGRTPATPDRIRADAAAMRARMLRDLPPDGPWDVKLRAGGQIEVEFIAQVLQLHPRAPRRRGLCSPDHAHRAGAAGQGRAAAAGGCRAADPCRPCVAHGAGHAAHHRRPRRARGAAGCLRARPAARGRRALDATGPVDLASAARHAG